MSERPRSRDMCIAGLGARTPLGLRALPSAAAVRAGVSRVREHPFMVDKTGEPFRVALADSIEEIDRVERMFALAASALDEVLEDLPPPAGGRLPVFLGLPEVGPTFSERRARDLCARLTAHLGSKVQAIIHPILEGNAAGIVALDQADALLQADSSAICVVGGVDSHIDPSVLEALDVEARVASSANRWGFPPGEGAGMLLVCNAGIARQYRRRSLAKVASLAITEEPNRMGTKTICLGVGLTDALSQAASGAGGPVTSHYCDINGERYREHEFSYAVLRVAPSQFVNVIDYVAPADTWGHTGAATAPLLAMLPILFQERGSSPGPGQKPMIWCGSENGRRGAVVLHLEERTS